MHAVSLKLFALQAAMNAMIIRCFTVVRVYKFFLSPPGEHLYSKCRSSFLALGKLICLLLFPPTRNSGKG